MILIYVVHFLSRLLLLLQDELDQSSNTSNTFLLRLTLMLGGFEFVRTFMLVCLIILVNHERYMHNAEIHLNANSVFILASKC